MAEVHWSRLREDEFNSFVEALIVRARTSGGLIARAVDGRGGDGGIDIDVRVKSTEQLTQIFQLKYFPEGFSNGFKSRRRQIKESFDRAQNESPPMWTLVVPRNPTRSERIAVFLMGKGTKTRVEIMGPAELNGLLSKHPDLQSYFQRDQAVEILRTINRPEALMAKPGDAYAETMRIREKLDSVSIYWRPDFHTEPDGTFVETFIPKRDDAAEREPLSVSLRTQFQPEHAELRKEFETKMKYGGSGTLILPAEVISEVRRIGPEWFADDSSPSEVHIQSIGDTNARRVSLSALDVDGQLLSNLSGVTTLLDRGSSGSTVEMSLRGGLGLVWRFSDDRADGGGLSFKADPVDATPREVRSALRFTRALEAGTRLELTVDDGTPVRIQVDPGLSLDLDPAFETFVDDLCAIEDHFELQLRLPAEGIDGSELVWARVLRRMIEGQPTPMPRAETFSGTLNGESGSELDSMLREGSAICISHEAWAIDLLGERITVGLVYIFSGRTHIDGADSILRALQKGRAEGMKITVRPDDGAPFVIYAPKLLTPTDDEVKVYPWDIPGVPEHRGFTALPNAADLPSPGEKTNRPGLRK